jgi:leucyl/phenylalanyl-tRNA---protein transferase
LTWFCPPWRAILEFDRVHVPRSLVRARKNSTLRFTIDQEFETVIRACSKVERAHEKGTWINAGIIRAYCGLHARGTAHSVEAWEGDTLVGGIYGVDAGGVFGGESMFHFQPNASKLALLFLIDHLRTRGAEWMDIQVMSPHMEALGAIEISRGLFLRKLADAQMSALKLF